MATESQPVAEVVAKNEVVEAEAVPAADNNGNKTAESTDVVVKEEQKTVSESGVKVDESASLETVKTDESVDEKNESTTEEKKEKPATEEKKKVEVDPNDFTFRDWPENDYFKVSVVELPSDILRCIIHEDKEKGIVRFNMTQFEALKNAHFTEKTDRCGARALTWRTEELPEKSSRKLAIPAFWEENQNILINNFNPEKAAEFEKQAKETIEDRKAKAHCSLVVDGVKELKLSKGGSKKLTKAQLERHGTGIEALDPSTMRTKMHKEKMERLKDKFEKRIELTAKAEKRHKETSGFIANDGDDVVPYSIRQRELAEASDLTAAVKQFELKLPRFGPYHLDYTDNGRHLLIGGRRGHVASIDWQTKKLHSENNVMESVNDVKFLHTENYIAVAQKHYTYVYDNTGTELHCLKNLYDVVQLEFLPHHFLLAASSRTSFLSWLDVSVGKMVSSFGTKSGPLDVMCKNPANAIIHTGHTNGTVSLWSPNSNEPLVKLLAHLSSVKGIDVDEQGKYMVTTGLDRKCRVWDVRMYKQLYVYDLPFGVSRVAISQKLKVACAVGNYVQIFENMTSGKCTEPYLVHNCGGPVQDLKFVPWEDVLGVGHSQGFLSMLVPGAGEANVDQIRSNPYETKNQRREREVKQLLDKIQPEMISLNPDDINRVNEDLLELEQEERKKILYVKPVKVIYTPKHKMRGKGSGSHKENRKQVVKADVRVSQNKEKEEMEREVFGRGEKHEIVKKHVLDRFKS